MDKYNICSRNERTNGAFEVASFDINTNTITIAYNYIDINLTKLLFVHELIHFFDYNGFKNIYEYEVKLVNNKIKHLLNFQLNPFLFVKVYNNVIKLKWYNVPKDFAPYLRKRGYSAKNIFHITNEYRAFIGHNYYCSQKD